ncbi:MAG: YceI family protein [bacterium]|nr:YceI family protein [bacterium]
MVTWIADKTHSNVGFKVKHLMITTVTGEFADYNIEIESDREDFTDATIKFDADINSIDTKVEQRNAHLKSDDFFNAEAFPKLTFESTSFKHKSGSDYVLEGNLTIRDNTHPVTLAVEYGGTMTDFYGNTKAGFELSGTINRKEFGLKWDAVTEAGGIVVAESVKLVLNVQLLKVVVEEAVLAS